MGARDNDGKQPPYDKSGAACDAQTCWRHWISVAIKTQRTKHAIPWLIQKPDKYFAAWRRVWAFRGGSEPDATTVTPLQAQLRASPHPIRSPGQELKQELGERLAPMTDQQSQSAAHT